MSGCTVFLTAMLALAASVNGIRKRYDGHEVWTLTPITTVQLEYLVHLNDNADKYELDFWRDPSGTGSPVMVRVPPGRQAETRDQLGLRGLTPAVTIRNLQRAIDREHTQSTQGTQPALSQFNYAKYNPLDEVVVWMQTMKIRFPNRVSLFTIATSYEGRSITAMKITSSRSSTSKPGFFLNGGMHSREWISPATVIYMASKLIEDYGIDPSVTEAVDAMDWYVLPVFNVDGYEYTWASDRMWRKTRSKNSENCVGVDPNRNWGYKWCQRGASKNPCSIQYCGPRPASESEVKGVADFLEEIPGRFAAFVDVHGYSQLWLMPWGYTRTFPPKYQVQAKCAESSLQALSAVHGTKYRKGTAARAIYVASGTAMDWAYGAAKIPFAVTIELRDKGAHGFLLPADQIIPSGQETLSAILAMAKCVVNNI